jgi:uncharacterized protein (TIGR02466 family)
MKNEVFGVFPTPVLKFKYDRPFTEEEINFINNKEKEVVGPPFIIHLGNSTTESKRILENPEMAYIKAYIQTCLDEWIKQIMMPKIPGAFKLKITQSWLNYTKPGEHHGRHVHPNSVVSGVLYINADEKHDMITFSKDKFEQLFIDAGQFNQFNTNQANVTVGKNDLVLFPSMLGHEVPKTTGSHTRISLAFNTFYEGQIGFINDAPNYLEIHSVR